MCRKILSLVVIFCFFLTTLGPIPKAHADGVLGLPAPGTMVNLSPAYNPVIIKGLTVHKDNPFLFDFIVDVGQDKMSGEPLKKEGEKLIKYFLASLAIPDKDVWVNLSPYEKNRMIPEALGQTDMGRDLLEQDYILKQITASLIYPEKQLGKTFWDKVYAKAQKDYGTTQIPVNTFNKVWIMADKAEVFEHNQTAFVVNQHLKVMLEEDYLALSKHADGGVADGSEASPASAGYAEHAMSSQIVKQIILPELEKEVNTGKNFANLRQIFNSIILSSWYKKNLKEALLNQVYADKSKVNGVIASEAKQSREQIYEQYLKAYKKGVFNYIKEGPADVSLRGGEADEAISKGTTIPRKYFSGGINKGAAAHPVVTHNPLELDAAMGSNNGLVDFSTLASTKRIAKSPDAAMIGVVPSQDRAMNAIIEQKALQLQGRLSKMEDGRWQVLLNDGAVTIGSLDVVKREIAILSGNIQKDEIVKGSNGEPFLQVWQKDRDTSLHSWMGIMFLIVQLGGFQTSSFETINDKLPLLPILISWGIKRGRNIPYTSGRLEAELLQWLGAFKAVIDKAQTADAAMGASVSKTVAELPGYLYSEDVLWNFKNRNEITVVFEFPPTAEQKARELSAQVVPFDLRAGVLNLKWVLRQFLGPDQSSFLANISFHPEISTISVTISLKGPEETGVLAEKKTPPGTLSAAGEVLVDKSMTAIPKGQAYRIADLVMNDIQLVKKEDMWWWNNKYGRDMQSFTTTYLSPQLGELALTYYTTINSGWSNVELSMKGRTYNYTWNPHADLSHTWQSGVGNSKDPGDIDTNAQLKKIIGELLLWRGISEQEVIQFAAVIATQEKGHSNAAMLSPALGGAVLARMQKVMEELVGQQKPDWLQSAEITPNYRFELKVGGQEQWGFVGVDSFGGGGRNIRVYWRSVLGAGSVHNFRPDQQDEILKQTEEDMRLVFRNARAHAAWEQAQKLDRETAQPAQGFGALMTTVSLASVKKAIGDFMEARYDFYRKLSDDVRPNFRFPSPALVFYNGVKIFRNSNISNFSAAAAQDAFARLSKGPDRKYSYEVSENGVSIFDAAMASAVTPLAVQKTSVVAFPGGIDLNTSSGMQWKLSKDGRGVEMNVDPAMIERVRREGIDSLSPVIFKITPVASVWPLVGLAAPR